jgi:hypothetical protein
LLQQWREKLHTQESILTFAHWVLVIRNNKPQFHLIMVGHNLFGKSLHEVDPQYWEKQWRYPAEIRVPASNEAVAKYFSKIAVYSNSEINSSKIEVIRKSSLDFYKINLLRKLYGYSPLK